MHPIIYDVAVSLDGFIAGPDGDISKFAHEGPVVDAYFERLGTYAVAIMGRETYTFGYRFGMVPGQNPYPHMRTLVFSETLDLPMNCAVEVMRDIADFDFDALQREASGPIYLCGGGVFAGALLRRGKINMLRLKRAPILLGRGVPLFSDLTITPDLQHVSTRSYDGGYLFEEFTL